MGCAGEQQSGSRLRWAFDDAPCWFSSCLASRVRRQPRTRRPRPPPSPTIPASEVGVDNRAVCRDIRGNAQPRWGLLSAVEVALDPSKSARDDSFVSFFEAEYDGLYRALLLLVGSRSEADELAQEAMARVYE